MRAPTPCARRGLLARRLGLVANATQVPAACTPPQLDGSTRAGEMGTKKPARVSSSGFEKESGGDLLSHRGNSAVPSALEGLTSEFGMRSGGAPPVKPPEIAEMVAPSSDGAVVEPPCEAVRVE